MSCTLTQAESADFAAAAAAEAFAPDLKGDDKAPHHEQPHDQLGRFTLKRFSRKHEAIAETEDEDGPVLASPSSSDTTGSLSTGLKHSVGPQDFDLLCVIGQGAFGKVIQVRHQPTNKILAMKVRGVNFNAWVCESKVLRGCCDWTDCVKQVHCAAQFRGVLAGREGHYDKDQPSIPH